MTRTIPLALALALFAQPALAERRAALLIGENAGDAADVPLRYAESDAEHMRDVLVDLGGVAPQDATLMQGATAAEVRGALAHLQERFAREGWGKADRLYLFVSSHAKAGELHLAGTHLPLAELRAFVDRSPVGLAVLVLDSCESGAATRAKGVVIAAGPTVRFEQAPLTGRVVIASAGAREASFESEDWGGSLFTQNFVAGLRGAADATHDGRVTLQEAYAYAYGRTVESAAAAGSSPQTPVFDLELAGEGELVLAELRRGRAQLLLAVDEPGEWLVSPVDDAAALVRVVKGVGPATLALKPGTYRLRTRRGDVFVDGLVRAADGAEVVVRPQDLHTWRVVPGGRKGAATEQLVLVWGALANGLVPGLATTAGWAAGWRRTPDAGAGEVLAVTFEHRVARPADGSFVQRELVLDGSAGWWFRAGALGLRATADAGLVAVRQEGLPDGARLGLQPSLGATLGADLPLAPWLRIDAAVRGAAVYVRSAIDSGVVPVVAVTLGVGVPL